MDLEFGRLLFSLLITLGVSTFLFVMLMRALERRRKRVQAPEEQGGGASVAQVSITPIPEAPRPLPAAQQGVQSAPVHRPQSVTPVQQRPVAAPPPPSRKDDLPVWE